MQAYILSVLGIVLVSVLIEIILPSGQTAKYIKGMFSIFVVFVLINPVIKFFKSDFDVSKYLVADSVAVDKKLLKNLYESQIETSEKNLQMLLDEEGFKNVKVSLVYDIVEEELIIEKAKINIDELVITNQNTNINKYQFIRQVVAENLKIKEEDVIFE